MSQLHVLTVLGTRPEIIRLSRVIACLDKFTTHTLVHTGQNYDYELSQAFFDELEIRRPDYFLDADTSSLGRLLGNVLIAIEAVLERERPDAFLVLGDTNSCLAAIIARRMKIPVYHMEAGNRCFDGNVPEEVNRRIIDHVADFNLVYTERSRTNLLREGLHPRRVYLTGSPLREVLDYFRPGIEQSNVLSRLGVEPHKFFVVSIHREENVDNRSNLVSLLGALGGLREVYGLPVIVSTHPRTAGRLRGLGDHAIDDGIVFRKPFGYFDYNKLQLNATCTLSDSGTVSEESAILGFPAVTVRNAMERPEAMDSGSVLITGLEPDAVLDGVRVTIGQSRGPGAEIPPEYCVRNTAQRVLNLIVGTARLHARWSGLQRNDPFWSSDEGVAEESLDDGPSDIGEHVASP